MKKYLHDFKLIRKLRLTPEYFVMILEAPEKLQEILPGQFVEIKVPSAQNTFLRRPFSIHDVDYRDNTMSILVQIVGEGSRTLSYIEEGDYINMLYPLGNSFSMPDKKDNVLLIGGGCGIAPLLYTAKHFNEAGITPTILIGGRSKQNILRIDEYEKYGEVKIITEDNTVGEKGMVTDHSVWEKEKFDKIVTCGPEPMMKAIAKKAQEKNIDCEVSLENTMACGIGACLCCVTETTEGHKCVCTEGPVFNVKDLLWQI